MNWITSYVRPKISNLLQRKQMPDNLWVKCPQTGEMVFHKDLEANMGVIPSSGYHMRISATERLGYFFDNGEFERIDPPKVAADPLKFRDKSRYADKLIRSFRIKTPSRDTKIKSLSGGNIQKAVVARELSRDPRVLIAAQPTRGVDIGATEYIHALLLEQRQNGLAILLISEDLDEIMALSDRIAVIYEGQIMGIVNGEEATAEQLGLLMAGVREEVAC